MGDPTELKTFASAMLCTCGGMILPENPLDLTQSAVCRCKECPSTLPALQVSSQERNIMMERESIQRDDVPGLEDFLARQKKTLAPTDCWRRGNWTRKHIGGDLGRRLKAWRNLPRFCGMSQKILFKARSAWKLTQNWKRKGFS